ncbi:MAG: MMPL family transporter [Chloroflexi bacterium]|nr:MMPL family transporter [Chloroflexota bacterium]
MAINLSTEGLARSSSNRPWITIGIWVAILALAMFLNVTLLGSATTTEFRFTNGVDSQAALDLLEERLRGPRPMTEMVIVQSETLTVEDAEFRGAVEEITATIEKFGPEVILLESVVNFYRTDVETMVSPDRRSSLIIYDMTGDVDDGEDHVEDIIAAVEGLTLPDGFEVIQVGNASSSIEINDLSERDLLRGEGFGLLIAMGILVLVFGALVAAILPVVTAAVSIIIAIGLAALVGQIGQLSFFVTNMITMIGLAVGIDYSLFIVQRYREERSNGLDKLDAIERSGGTAGRAVFFSGVTVILALFGMLIVPNTIFISLGLGAILVTIVALAASMTLLPAMLSILGDRVNKGRIPLVSRSQNAFDEQKPGGFWDTITHAVMGKPVLSLFLAGGLLIVLAIPFLDLKTGFNSTDTLPDSLTAKRGFLILDKEFSAGEAAPSEIVIDGPIDAPETQSAIAALTALMAENSDFREPKPLQVNEARDLALLEVPVNGSDSSQVALDALAQLRGEYIPTAFANANVEVYVTGAAAGNQDFIDVTKNYAPIVFGFVLALSFILLTVVFRTIVVPIKAIILNLLAVGAAYGLLVAVFQKGWGNGIFGFQQVEVIEAWIPLFLFSVLFGLSMDYEVFLLSRIREHYDKTKDNRGSVAFGLRTTGRLITGAALIMVAVFGGFASGELVMFQQMGFGLGAAILLDATIVRSVLVPSAMALMGRWNWYFPSFLNWVPDLRVEVEEPSSPPVVGGGT